MFSDKRFLGIIVNVVISTFSLFLVAYLLHKNITITILAIVIGVRILASFFLFDEPC